MLQLRDRVEEIGDTPEAAVGNYDLVVVTKDCSDFSALLPGEHESLILVANHAHSPIALAEMIDKLPDAYPSRQAFGSKEEHADDWVSH